MLDKFMNQVNVVDVYIIYENFATYPVCSIMEVQVKHTTNIHEQVSKS